ncbi:MAG: zinc ABC transporter substrate-binding protein [Clostridia bacterium]|nr:zinc ABC transporter substrate-binding protein [Clostridia bacterium]
MSKKTFKIVQLLLISVLLTTFTMTGSGCALKERFSRETTVPDSSLPVVYTSIYPLYDFTKKIGGEKVTVINITPAGAEPHSFEPSPQLLAKLSQASLFLYNGAGMEPYLEKLRATLQESSLLMVEASQGINLIKDKEERDPHFWLSPSCALTMGHNILQALIHIDPDNRTYYEKNFQTFAEKLRELDQDYKKTLTQCPGRKIIVTHQAFNYLCQEYDLEQIPLMGLHAEAEPTPGKLKEISILIEKEKIKYLFSEALYSPKTAATIARETGATVLQLHPLGSLNEKELQEGKDYFQIMRENLQNLQQALEIAP